MKGYMVIRTPRSTINNSQEIVHDSVYLQLEDALAKQRELQESHEYYTNYHNTETLFNYQVIILNLVGDWIDV